MEILDRVTIVAVRPSFLSGSRRLESGKESDARRKTVLQDVLDPKALNQFNQMSTALFRLCRTYGSKLKLLDAWAVENRLAEELLQKLAAFDDRFKKQAAAFVESFPSLNIEWANKHPTEAEAIIGLAYSREELERGFRFAYAGFQLTPEQVQAAAGLDEELEGMAGQALKEFADMIRDMGVKDPGKHVFTGAIAGVLGQIARKASSLAFLNPRIGEVADVLNGVLKMLPTKGKVDDAQSIVLRVVVDRLMNPSELVARGFPKLAVEAEEEESVSRTATHKAVANTVEAKPEMDFSDWSEDEESDDIGVDITGIVGQPEELPDEAVVW